MGFHNSDQESGGGKRNPRAFGAIRMGKGKLAPVHGVQAVKMAQGGKGTRSLLHANNVRRQDKHLNGK